MPTFDHLFIIIISVLVLSVILSIIDWIYLTTLSTKATLLEREVEKRTQEFDAFKKDRPFDQPPATGSIAVYESNDPLEETATTTTTTTAISNDDTIQIVRNIRGTFETSEHASQTLPPETPQEDISQYEEAPVCRNLQDPPVQDTPAAESFQSNSSILSTPPSETSSYEINSSLQPLPPAVAPEDSAAPPSTEHVLTGTRHDAKGKTELPPLTEAMSVFRLFSDASKDADFKILWHNINHALTHQQTPHITVDFDKIHFIYTKEMEYLEKMYYLIAEQGGSLSFINCDEELTELLNNNTLLRSIVKNKPV